MRFLFCFILSFAFDSYAATGSREDDIFIYGGGIALLGLILGIIYLSGFIKRKIREYKKKVTEES